MDGIPCSLWFVAGQVVGMLSIVMGCYLGGWRPWRTP